MGEEEEGEESGEKEPNFVFLVGSPYIIPKSEKLTLEIWTFYFKTWWHIPNEIASRAEIIAYREEEIKGMGHIWFHKSYRAIWLKLCACITLIKITTK